MHFLGKLNTEILFGGFGMKFFIRRGGTCTDGFTIYNDNAEPVCTAYVEASPSLRITMSYNESKPVSTIKFNTFMLNYFTIRCSRRFYALVPCINKQFSFAIYGSTFRFIGNLADGRFSMLNSNGEVIMTQKKCWTQQGEGYEVNITEGQYHIFMLSVALCADIYIALTESHPIPT